MDGGVSSQEEPAKAYHPLLLVILVVIVLLAIITTSFLVIIFAPKWKLAKAQEVYSESTMVDASEIDENGYIIDNPTSRPVREVISSSESTENGISIYDRLIQNAASDTEKAGYFIDRAFELYILDKNAYSTQILSDAYSAEELVHTAYTADKVAYYELRLGSEEVAAKYFCLAYERDPSYITSSCPDVDIKEEWLL